MRGNRMIKTGHSLGRLALLLALLLALCGFSGALAEADAAQAAERTALVDAANGNFEADMLDMLSQYAFWDTEELEVRAEGETGFSAAVVKALARLRSVTLNISYKTGDAEKNLRLVPRDALLLCELDGSLSFESAAEQLEADHRGEVEALQALLIAGETPDLPADGMIDPMIPRFMQSTIRSQSGENTILGNAQALRAGTLSAEDFPPVRLWMDEDGKIWSLDHRRLAAYKLAGLREVPFRWATEVEYANDYWKMTTEDNGESVVMRLDEEGVEDPVLHRDGTITGLTGELADMWAASLAAAPAANAGNLFDNAEINRLIDENYQQVLENGYAELRIPLSLHGMTEDVFTENARDVASRLLENGYKACVIGGCIRDFIMGKESNDIDFVTDATLEQQRAIFGDAFQTHISSGNVYGGVSYPDEYVDLATFQNVPPHFAGLPGVPEFDPTVPYTDSALLDSFERDLTINAIYYDMSTGDLVDFHGGLHDIREGILKTMADARAVLPENPLIVLRTLRFQARFSFAIDENLDAAIREIGAQALSSLNQHTMLRNANWMMMTGKALDCYHLLAEYGLMDTIYPPVDRVMNDAGYTDYLEKALNYMDKLCADRGEDISDELALLAFLQPEIDRRAQRSGYEKALCGVLDEQEMSFELDNIRQRLEGVSQLAHDMEQIYSRYMEGAVRRSEYFDDALALLNMKFLSDDSLREQAAFWNDDAWWEAEDMDDAA